MSTPETTQEPAPKNPINKVLDDKALKAKEVPEVTDFIQENGMSLLIGIGLAVALYLGISAYRNYKTSESLNASALLFNAQSAEQLQKVINEHASTPSAPLAYLSLAANYFDAGQFDMAQYQYTQFETKYPEHSLRAMAQLGQANCLEAKGQLNEAVNAFTQFSQTWTNSYLLPLAIFGKARCYEEMGQFDEARTIYEDYIAAHPDSDWAQRAETALLFVDKEKRAKTAM